MIEKILLGLCCLLIFYLIFRRHFQRNIVFSSFSKSFWRKKANHSTHLFSIRMNRTSIPSKAIDHVSSHPRLSNTNESSNVTAQRFWGKWVLALLVITLLYLVLMPVAPFLFMDEFMIVDLGRVLLQPGTDWSINWLVNQGQAVFLFTYLGSVLQELSFQIIGQYGPRISGLMGAFAAATIMIKWLLSGGVPKNAAFLLGMAFLLDPLFVQAYSMGRVDGWAIAFCITSCWILRNVAQELSSSYSFSVFSIHLLISGACAVIGLFIWPSAIFLFPLIVLELVYLIVTNISRNGSLKKALIPLILFGTGGFVAGMLLLVPIAPKLFTQLSNVTEMLKVNTQSGPDWGDNFRFGPLWAFVSSLKFTPVFSLMALIGAFWWRNIGLVLATLASMVLMLVTIVYMHRVLYLVPYLIALTASIYQRWSGHENKFFTKYLQTAGIVVLLVWSVGLSIGIRSILTFKAKGEKDRSVLYHAAQSMIGQGDHAVFLLSSTEFYYSGRSLGWKMYSTYLPIGENLSPEVLNQHLGRIDYLITTEPMAEKFGQDLKTAGMQEQDTYYLYDYTAEEFNGINNNTWRMRSLYHIYEQPYGPYKLYIREGQQLSAGKLP